jgi:hypothetical protein
VDFSEARIGLARLRVRVCITIAQATVIVATHQCVAALTNASTRVALDVPIIQTVIQPMSVARRRFLWTKPSAQPIVSAELVIQTMTVLVEASVVDLGSVQTVTRSVTISVHLILSAIWINIVARRRVPAIGGIVVPKVVWARSVGLTTTVGLEMSAVFLTNVLIVAARVVLQTQTVVPDITVVRKDTGMLVNSVSVVSIVLGNLVVRTVTVVDQKNAVFLINVLIMVVHVLQIQIAVPDSTVVKDDTRMSYLSVVQTVLENLVVRAITVVAPARLATLIIDAHLTKTATLSHHG